MQLRREESLGLTSVDCSTSCSLGKPVVLLVDYSYLAESRRVSR